MIPITNIFKALSDPNRLKVVITLIKNRELCACDITTIMNVTSATVSRHMAILIQSSIIKSRKEGRWVYYSINTEIELINEIVALLEKEKIVITAVNPTGDFNTCTDSCSKLK